MYVHTQSFNMFLFVIAIVFVLERCAAKHVCFICYLLVLCQLKRFLDNSDALLIYVQTQQTHVLFPTYVVHHLPQIWKDPFKVDPDRFLRKNKIGRHPCAFLPFSFGRRTCIGMACVYAFVRF